MSLSVGPRRFSSRRGAPVMTSRSLMMVLLKLDSCWCRVYHYFSSLPLFSFVFAFVTGAQPRMSGDRDDSLKWVLPSRLNDLGSMSCGVWGSTQRKLWKFILKFYACFSSLYASDANSLTQAFLTFKTLFNRSLLGWLLDPMLLACFDALALFISHHERHLACKNTIHQSLNASFDSVTIFVHQSDRDSQTAKVIKYKSYKYKDKITKCQIVWGNTSWLK